MNFDFTSMSGEEFDIELAEDMFPELRFSIWNKNGILRYHGYYSPGQQQASLFFERSELDADTKNEIVAFCDRVLRNGAFL